MLWEQEVASSSLAAPTIFLPMAKKMKPSGFASCTEGALHATTAALHIRLTTCPAIALAKTAEALLRSQLPVLTHEVY